MEPKTIDVMLFCQTARLRHLNLNQLLQNAFSEELKRSDEQYVKIEPSKTGSKTIKLLNNILK